jgi:hypothetical protein
MQLEFDFQPLFEVGCGDIVIMRCFYFTVYTPPVGMLVKCIIVDNKLVTLMISINNKNDNGHH